jgi:uncharacterized membrane protein (DUF373 family)
MATRAVDAEAARERRPASAQRTPMRERIAKAFTHVEDGVYLGLAVLLAGAAVALLGSILVDFASLLATRGLRGSIVELIDQGLLVLMLVELLYTVQVSFREHVLIPEPFLLVALIAGVRRILVLTAELAKVAEQGETAFRHALIELAILTVMTVALVACLAMLKRRATQPTAERA